MASSSRTVELDNCLGSLPMNSVDRLTARLDMTLIVLTGPKILKTNTKMICGRNWLWYHFIMQLFEPENY